MNIKLNILSWFVVVVYLNPQEVQASVSSCKEIEYEFGLLWSGDVVTLPDQTVLDSLLETLEAPIPEEIRPEEVIRTQTESRVQTPELSLSDEININEISRAQFEDLFPITIFLLGYNGNYGTVRTFLGIPNLVGEKTGYPFDIKECVRWALCHYIHTVRFIVFLEIKSVFGHISPGKLVTLLKRAFPRLSKNFQSRSGWKSSVRFTKFALSRGSWPYSQKAIPHSVVPFKTHLETVQELFRPYIEKPTKKRKRTDSSDEREAKKPKLSEVSDMPDVDVAALQAALISDEDRQIFGI